MEKKHPCHTLVCVLADAWFGDLKIKFVENNFFLENYVSLEEAVSHNVLHYQQLSIACYQVSFYAYNYFE